MSAPLLLQEFERGFAALSPARRDAAGLGIARREQLAAALADGLPGTRAERWRHTSLRALERRAFSPLPAESAADSLVDELAAAKARDPDLASGWTGLLLGLERSGTPCIVFVNGIFAPLLSQLDAAAGSERVGLAHRLKGAARAIGAFALGDAAQALEAAPLDAAAVMNVTERVTELRPALLRAMGRGG